MAGRVVVSAVVLLVVTSGLVRAHDPDTSYARFKVDRQTIETTLIYDLFTLVRIDPRLDANADRQVTAEELTQRSSAIAEYLRERIAFEIDGQPAEFGELQPVSFPPGVGDSIPEQDYHEATSLIPFTFRRRSEQPVIDFWVRFDFFTEVSDQHTVLGLIEQDGQEYQVLFREGEPDYLFDTGYEPLPTRPLTGMKPETSRLPELAVEDQPEVETTPPSRPSGRSNTSESVWAQLASFFRLGVEHIFLGYDHILFLLSLIVLCRLRELVKIVTSFTVAHTITLILATLEVVELPGRLVETAIAATIVYVAVENFWINDTAHRWRLTFVFGLIHGFGFAGVLRELGLPTIGLVRSLVSFNVGVEAGQLAIVLVLFPLSIALMKWKYGGIARGLVSGLIALCGLGWFVDRAFGFGFMPF